MSNRYREQEHHQQADSKRADSNFSRLHSRSIDLIINDPSLIQEFNVIKMIREYIQQPDNFADLLLVKTQDQIEYGIPVELKHSETHIDKAFVQLRNGATYLESKLLTIVEYGKLIIYEPDRFTVIKIPRDNLSKSASSFQGGEIHVTRLH